MGEMTARLARASVATEDVVGATRHRISQLLRELLATHSEALLALLAENAIEPEAQIERMNALVSALVGVEFEEDLRVNGRSIPLFVDQTCTPPKIRLHRKLIEGIEDAEVLRAFHAPVAGILGVSPVGVGLMLSCDDARQVKSLVAQVARRAGADRVHITQVEAIVAQRLQLFNARLEVVAENFGESMFWLRVGEDDFKAQLGDSHIGWPDWDAVQSSAFIQGLIGELRDCIDQREDMPAAQMLVELCWESLELSPHAFLRHAAQTLRAREGDYDLAQTIRKLADANDIEYCEAFYAVDAWPIFRDLSDAWQALFQAEQAMLPGGAPRRRTPSISVLDCPLDSLGICEPCTLPWDAPLVAWSIREHHGLRDLLVGLRVALEEQASGPGEIEVAVSGDAAEAPLGISEAPQELHLQVVQRGFALPEDYEALLNRAMNACHAAMAARFKELDAAGKTRALRVLRSAYDGYFGQLKALWGRRFQAWEKWSPEQAFRVLSTEIRHIAGPAMLFDPFAGPESAAFAPAPQFILVAPRPEQFERVLVHMPLAALKKSIHGAAIQVRVVDVRDGQDCRWVGDAPVSLSLVEQSPTGTVLESIDRDSVRLLIQAGNPHF